MNWELFVGIAFVILTVISVGREIQKKLDGVLYMLKKQQADIDKIKFELEED
jgi:hypothetical protein